MKLSPKESDFYSRHLLLDTVGMNGQLKLKNAKVLVVGAGGLGCPVLLYLTAAGVGTIGVIDFDVVELSNLQRQILFNISDVGQPKAKTAKVHLQLKNPFVTVTDYNEMLTNKNAISLFRQYDIIVDTSDNFSTRYMVNDACVLTGKPLIYGAIHKFQGQVSVFNYNNGPTYRCLFPDAPGEIPSCSEVGVLGVLPGLIATHQANETLKIILELGDILSGDVLIIDALKASFLKINIKKSIDLSAYSIASEKDFENYDYDFFCTSKNEITNTSFLNLPEDVCILDVRNNNELPKINFKNVICIPYKEIAILANKIPKSKQVYVVCQQGITSLKAIKFLEEKHQFTNLINIENGLLGD